MEPTEGSGESPEGIKGLPGLGSEEFPGFPTDECPEELPDLSQHHSVTAELLKREPELYYQLRDLRTKLGVGLGKCIKTGMDNRGHPMIRTLGAVAGDEDCYETFRPFFDALIRERHGGAVLAQPHPDVGLSGNRFEGLTAVRADPSGKYVLSTQVRAARSLQGVPFPPAASLEQRREVERVATRALLELEGPLKGLYYPLIGSQSYMLNRGGMTPAEEQELANAGILFRYPDSTTALCSGVGRNWPDARGIFANSARDFFVWLNEEEHVRAVSMRRGDDAQAAFRELSQALDGMTASFRLHGDGPTSFAHSKRLGYLTSCPSNLGTAMRVSIILRLPLLAALDEKLSDMSEKKPIAVRGAVDEKGFQLKGVLEVSNRDRLGISEVKTVNLIVEAAAELVRQEQALEAKQNQSPIGASVARAKSATPVLSEQDEASWEVAGRALSVLFARAVAETGQSPAEAKETAAATKIQAIHRGHAAREEVATMKSGETAAATKIQAIHRGHAAREEVAKKKSIHAAESAAATRIQSIHRGSVVRQEATMKSIKEKARKQLFQAWSEGGLNRTLTQMVDESEAWVRDIKTRAAMLLTESCQSGELRQVLEMVKEEFTKSKSNQSQVSDVIRQAGDTLCRAAQSGALSSALAQVTETEACGLQAIMAKAANTLFKAYESGELAKALETLHPEPAQAAAMTEDQAAVRIQAVSRGRRTRGSMAQTGGVGPSSVTTGASGPQDLPSSIEDDRRRMQELLTQTLEDGSLKEFIASCSNNGATARELPGSTVAEVPDSRQGGSSPTLEEVRAGLKEVLESAAEDGSLAEILKSTASTRAPVNDPDEDARDHVRLKMQKTLTVGLDDGSLENALQSIANQRAAPSGTADESVPENSEPERIEQLEGEEEQLSAQASAWSRTEERIKQLEDAEDRSRARASARSRAKEQMKQSEDMQGVCVRMLDLLAKAADDGSLEQVLLSHRTPKHSGKDVEEELRMAVSLEQSAEPTREEEAAQSETTLQEVLPAAPEAGGGPGGDMEDLCDKVKHYLQDCFQSGRLEDWLMQGNLRSPKHTQNGECTGARDLSTGLALEANNAAQPPTSFVPPKMKALPEGAHALLESVSNSDRRIGLLTAAIREVERRISEQTETAQHLVSKLEAARWDARSLDEEIDRAHMAIEQAELTHWKLQEHQQKLVDNIDLETMKQRHAVIEQEPGYWTARSETSTACTLRDVCTPRTAADSSRLTRMAPTNVSPR